MYSISRLIAGHEFNAPAKLRDLLKKGIIRCPGVWDATSARLVEEAGFDAAYIPGSDTSRAFAGVPDVGVRTATELIMNCEAIANSVEFQP